jgi:crotonobetainyl-CoA:carnitine CoA-transferase CaiB-like acyl-CoA transferase
VNWTPEYIRDKGYEMARNFLALNRGKRGVSLDLTTDTGRELALALIAGADMIVENQASGVLAKLGLGYEQVTRVNPEIVMVSMSAFGSGNDWSDTRAYGSTLEQGAGLPQFMGFPDDPPTMAHLAYGDPVGGLFGCAAGLTAMVERRRSGRGQYANVSMIEAMLQFATPALLAHQLDPRGVRRTGNRHIACAPHGFFAAAGDDQWIAVAVDSGAAFAQLARLIGREDWARDPSLTGPDSLSHRQARQDEFEEALQDWARTQEPRQAAADLQAAGVAAAPLLHAEELFDIPHFTAADFYIELVRELTGPQRQVGIAIMRDGARLGNRRPAPLLGEHSWEQLSTRLGIDRAQFEALLAAGVVSFAPAPSRNLVAAAPTS